MSTSFKKEIENFKRDLLANRLAQCSTAQQDLFNRLYANGVPEEKLESAIDLCERTIKKNIANPDRLLEKEAQP